MEIKEVYSNLCYFDLRNPDSIEDYEGAGNFAKKDCYCDNCFYGRSKLAEFIIELIEDNIKHFEQID